MFMNEENNWTYILHYIFQNILPITFTLITSISEVANYIVSFLKKYGAIDIHVSFWCNSVKLKNSNIIILIILIVYFDYLET